MADDKFPGFDEPTANYSKLPHAMIGALPQVQTMGELKVILYILRHTWGFQDDQKRITLDEFQHGRKRRDGTRLDGGTGMSKPSIVKGLELAEQHGFILIDTDDHDKGRIKKFYCLNMAPSRGKETLHQEPLPQESQSLTSDVKEPYSSGKEALHRTEKDTLETNQGKQTKGNTTDSDESVPPPPEHVDDIFPRTSEGKPLEPSNPLEVAARQRWGQRGEAWSVPESARSPTGWGDVVDEFAHLSGISPTDKVRGQWGKIFKDIADTWEVGPGVLVEVVRKIPESAALGWMQSWNPHNKSFQSSLGIMIGQHLDGGVVLDTRAEEAPQSRRDRIKDMIASGIAVG